jgi:hypothetical protein
MKRGFWIYFPTTLSVVIAAVVGLTFAWRSELWIVEDVRVQIDRAPSLAKDPISSQRVVDLLGVEKGKDLLSQLSGSELRRRVLKERWIGDVTVEKVFPTRIQVRVQTRDPIAVVQWAGGSLAYLDEAGETFGEFDFEIASDLPLLSGAKPQDRAALQKNAEFLMAWKRSKLNVFCQISQLLWKEEGVLEAVVSFPQAGGGVRRLSIDLGQEFDTRSASHFHRLERVLKTISARGIPARAVVFADGKKIVVRTARRS